MCAPHFPGHARPSPVLRDLAQITGLTGSTRPTRCPTSDPAACRSLQYHQPQHKLVPTPLCRVEPLDQVPLERLDAGLGDGVAPTKRSWRRHCLANVFAHGAVVLRALRGRLSTKSKLRRRGSRLQKDRRGADPRLRSLPAAPHASRQSSRPGAWARCWSSCWARCRARSWPCHLAVADAASDGQRAPPRVPGSIVIGLSPLVPADAQPPPRPTGC